MLMLVAGMLCLMGAALLFVLALKTPRANHVLYLNGRPGGRMCAACRRGYDEDHPHICVTALGDQVTVTTIIQPPGYSWETLAKTNAHLVS